jgi:hypothetical protein
MARGGFGPPGNRAVLLVPATMASDWGVRERGLGAAQQALNRLAALMLDLRPFWSKLAPCLKGSSTTRRAPMLIPLGRLVQ